MRYNLDYDARHMKHATDDLASLIEVFWLKMLMCICLTIFLLQSISVLFWRGKKPSICMLLRPMAPKPSIAVSILTFSHDYAVYLFPRHILIICLSFITICLPLSPAMLFLFWCYNTRFIRFLDAVIFGFVYYMHWTIFDGRNRKLTGVYTRLLDACHLSRGIFTFMISFLVFTEDDQMENRRIRR
jgi:hypothetical protein